MADTVESTAFGPMVIVGMEQSFPPAQRIVTDPVAAQMLPAGMRMTVNLAKISFLRGGLINVMEKASPGIYLEMACRKRYIEDTLRDTLTHGITSVVVLGAGLDTLAYRVQELKALHVYEVDLPDNIAHKKKMLDALYGSVPAHVTLVPLDFETQSLDTVLAQAGYSHEQRTFFAWEGVTQYLTEPAIRTTFEFLAKAAPGSRLVFTYVLKDFIDGTNRHGSEDLYQRFRVKNQIWQFGLDPTTLADFIGAYGWRVLEQIEADGYTSRYITPTGRHGAVLAIEPAVYAEKVG